MKKNIPEIPTLNWEIIIPKLEAAFGELLEHEKEDVKDILLYYGCEPMAAAERIGAMLNEYPKDVIKIL